MGRGGAKTPKLPYRRERTTEALRNTGRLVKRRASSPRHSTIAAAPSAGEQNMYCVGGCDSMGELRFSPSDSGLRRHAIGFTAPLRKALAATLASVGWVIPYS